MTQPDLTSFARILHNLYLGREGEDVAELCQRVMAADAVVRVNGHNLRGESYREHLQSLRSQINSGHTTVEEVEQPAGHESRIAGRYRFRSQFADGSVATAENHIFGHLTQDGRISQLVEVARMVEDSDDEPV